jgi:hypothetical protein
MYRKNKTDQWIGTLSYNFTRPFSNKGIAMTLKVAILLSKDKPKSRGDILYNIGIPKKRAYRKGSYTCLFTALIWNNVIEYDKKNKEYKKGNRYREYMEYAQKCFVGNPKLKEKYKKEYQSVLLEASNSLHFIFS